MKKSVREDHQPNRRLPETRRGFLRDSSILLAGAVPVGLSLADTQAAENPPLTVAIVGCGRRGIQLASRILEASSAARLVALADPFPDRLQQAARTLRSRFASQVDLTRLGRFTGQAADFRLIKACPASHIVLTGPPATRPAQLQLSVNSGQHLVSARPLAVDTAGLEQVAASLKQAIPGQIQVPNELLNRTKVLTTLAELQLGVIGDVTRIDVHCSARQLPEVMHRSTWDAQQTELRNWQYSPRLSGGGMLEEFVDYLAFGCLLSKQNPDRLGHLNRDGDFADFQPAEYNCLDNHLPAVDSLGARSSGKDWTAGEIVGGRFEFTGGLVMNAFWRSDTIAWRRPALVVHGSQGWCDVLAGRYFDLANQPVYPNLTPAPPDSLSLTEAVGELARSVARPELYLAACRLGILARDRQSIRQWSHSSV